MSASTAVLRGFAQPVHDSQRVFRHLLDAMAHPGRVVDLDVDLPPAGSLHPGALAFLLALADFETPLWLSPGVATEAVLGAVRFHCGAPIVADPSGAVFLVAAHTRERPRLDSLNLGSDAYPERAATLILQVDGLDGGREVVLSGPGIDGTVRLAIDGLDDAFWSEREALGILFPRGLDLVFVNGASVAAVPRSSCVEV